MQTAAERNRRAINLWTARLIPIVLAGVVGYATYILVVLLCVNYLLEKHRDQRAAIPILVVYFLLFLIMAVSFFRLVYVTAFDPPYLRLGPSAATDRNIHNRKNKTIRDYVAGGEYTSEDSTQLNNDPDSPGLELFYTKDVFVCEMDGKPKWCSECANWKPDRTHHCSDAGRCIRKMDHFCPWVGGPIGENNFKFFIQFTGYTALYCINLLVIMAVYVHRQIASQNEQLNRQFVAILGLASFFFTFTAGMTGTSISLAVRNLTQVEQLGAKSKVYVLAVLKPRPERLQLINPLLASGLSYPEITYPLSAPPPQIINEITPATEAPCVLSSERDRPNNVSQAPLAEPSVAQTDIHPDTPRIRDETLAVRDVKATRTFAILKMKPGENPWDLGSPFLNWQTVMGTSLIDWLLPIRRSPCCNHEDTESQFRLGPAVEHLRAAFGFVKARDVRGTGRRPWRRSSSLTGGKETSSTRRRRRRRRRTGHTEMSRRRDELASEPVGIRTADQTELRDMNQ